MNLELIKKYEKEFLHMLYGGTLLSRVMTSDEDGEMYTIWYKVDDKVLALEKWTSDYLFRLSDKECAYYKPQFIINDEYAPYRKALAEGKTIQFNENNQYHTEKWVDTSNTNPSIIFTTSPKYYRIKPEEPEFKVGDWITVNGPAGTFIECISGINDDTYTLGGTNICYKSQAIKWEPKEGDLCIVWNNDNINYTVIIKFDYIDASGKYSCSNTWWDNCMPFTGVLPPHMKDNK